MAVIKLKSYYFFYTFPIKKELKTEKAGRNNRKNALIF